jgi:hypothetical protein
MLATKPSNDTSGLRKAREFTTVINHYTHLFEKLKMIQKMSYERRNVVGLVTDFTTWWWSTYLLLDRVLRLKHSIRKLIFDELYNESRSGKSAIAKCTLDKHD